MSAISKVLLSAKNFVLGPSTTAGLSYEGMAKISSLWERQQVDPPKLTKEASQLKETAVRKVEGIKLPPADGDILRLDLSKGIENSDKGRKEWQDIIHNRNRITPTHPAWGKAFWDNLKKK